MSARIPILLVLGSMALAGCTQLQDARDDAADALANAQREAQDAKDRYDRVKSTTIVRNETVDLVLVAVSANGTTWFEANATRAGVNVTRENLTALPPVRLESASWSTTCDPLTCRFEASDTVSVAWADGAAGGMELVGGVAGPDARMERPRAWALVTTSAGDVTD